jgi:hypothetical protein
VPIFSGGTPLPPPFCKISGINNLAENSRQNLDGKELRGQNLDNKRLRGWKLSSSRHRCLSNGRVASVAASTMIAQLKLRVKVRCHKELWKTWRPRRWSDCFFT